MKKEYSQGGFTLVETLVALAVLLVSLAGPLSLATKGLSSSLFARDQIVAFYLAQEAVEFVRQKRDNNALAGQSWLTGLSSCLDGNICSIDTVNNTIIACPSGSCPALTYDESSNFYNTQTGSNSIFTRSISLTTINANEVAIGVTVSWTTNLFPKTFKIRENILNWQ